jgi:hypothetical protein
MWFNLAAAGGADKAVGARDRVTEYLSQADIIETQQMARDWMKAHP